MKFSLLFLGMVDPALVPEDPKDRVRASQNSLTMPDQIVDTRRARRSTHCRFMHVHGLGNKMQSGRMQIQGHWLLHRCCKSVIIIAQIVEVSPLQLKLGKHVRGNGSTHSCPVLGMFEQRHMQLLVCYCTQQQSPSSLQGQWRTRSGRV